MRTQRQRKVASEASLGEVSELLSDEARVNEALGQLVLHLEALDSTIAPMIETDGAHFNERWGFLSRAGVNDKSLLSNQIEKCAAAAVTPRCCGLVAAQHRFRHLTRPRQGTAFAMHLNTPRMYHGMY